MRLFIAINFDEQVKDSLCSCIQSLKKCSIRGNFTHRENLHLTLAFIGETSKINAVKQAMDTVCEAPFVLTFSELGLFRRGEGDIYWIGVEKNTALDTIYSRLCTALRLAGFTLESREFKPHLTLGREIVLSDNFDKTAFAETITSVCMTVAKISLMKSERVDGRLKYTEIYKKKLGKTV